MFPIFSSIISHIPCPFHLVLTLPISLDVFFMLRPLAPKFCRSIGEMFWKFHETKILDVSSMFFLESLSQMVFYIELPFFFAGQDNGCGPNMFF